MSVTPSTISNTFTRCLLLHLLHKPHALISYFAVRSRIGMYLLVYLNSSQYYHYVTCCRPPQLVQHIIVWQVMYTNNHVTNLCPEEIHDISRQFHFSPQWEEAKINIQSSPSLQNLTQSEYYRCPRWMPLSRLFHADSTHLTYSQVTSTRGIMSAILSGSACWKCPTVAIGEKPQRGAEPHPQEPTTFTQDARQHVQRTIHKREVGRNCIVDPL